jgi:hypothetical protein
MTKDQVLEGEISWERRHILWSTIQLKYEELGCVIGIFLERSP